MAVIMVQVLRLPNWKWGIQAKMTCSFTIYLLSIVICQKLPDTRDTKMSKILSYLEYSTVIDIKVDYSSFISAITVV